MESRAQPYDTSAWTGRQDLDIDIKIILKEIRKQERYNAAGNRLIRASNESKNTYVNRLYVDAHAAITEAVVLWCKLSETADLLKMKEKEADDAEKIFYEERIKQIELSKKDDKNSNAIVEHDSFDFSARIKNMLDIHNNLSNLSPLFLDMSLMFYERSLFDVILARNNEAAWRSAISALKAESMSLALSTVPFADNIVKIVNVFSEILLADDASLSKAEAELAPTYDLLRAAQFWISEADKFLHTLQESILDAERTS